MRCRVLIGGFPAPRDHVVGFLDILVRHMGDVGVWGSTGGMWVHEGMWEWQLAVGTSDQLTAGSWEAEG